MKVVAGLSLLFCVGAYQIRIAAQNSTILSKQPPVTRVFDSDKNESRISAFLIDPQSDAFRGTLVYSASHPPPDIRLHSVEYTYPGNIPSRPQAMVFVFVPLEKYKTAPSFSVAADGTVLHQGEATLRELCCVEINGHKANPQHIVVAVPMEIFERIRQAKKIELKLTSKRGKYSFKVNDYQKKCLTALANTIE
jgi:hypothetical protein